MMKLEVILGQDVQVEGINTKTTLQEFRKQLKTKGYTEINTIYRKGKHIVTFLVGNVGRQSLLDADLIKGSKKEREEYKLKTKDMKTKINNFGYCW